MSKADEVYDKMEPLLKDVFFEYASAIQTLKKKNVDRSTFLRVSLEAWNTNETITPDEATQVIMKLISDELYTLRL